MKRIIKKTMPFVLAVLIVFQTIYTSLQTAQAAAIPEVLYYTYWDLINTIYATCGYDSKVDKSVVNNHSVTGKQAWSNFVTFVENSAKANYKFVGDGMSKAFSELENIVNTVTEKGISMTQDLYDMLKSVFADQVENEHTSNLYASYSVDQFQNMIHSITGGYWLDDDAIKAVIAGTMTFYVVNGQKSSTEGSCFMIFGLWANSSVPLISRYDADYNSYEIGYYEKGIFYKVGSLGTKVINGKSEDGALCTYWDSAPTFIINSGSFVGTDIISAQVSAEACPKEVPDVAPWRKSVDIPDEWRVINPNETPEQNPDDKPEVLPVVIPIHPTKPDTKPDTETTENPDTETTENPDKDKDPDKKKNPVVNPIINPDTGNVIDPNTGWDIDSSTGKLINPNTGELVDPDMSNPSSLVNKFGDITKLFPFCIPFDLVRLIKGMNAEKKPPVFHFEHEFKSIDYTFVVDVDLSDYDKYIKLFRYGMQIFYILALMFLTAKISTYFA